MQQNTSVHRASPPPSPPPPPPVLVVDTVRSPVGLSLSTSVAAGVRGSPRAHSTRAHNQHRRFALVIRGPLAHFTSVAIEYYLGGLSLGQRGVGVVFSHNTRSCANTTFLFALRDAHPRSFDWVLREPPPRLGVGFRNAQREASHHGISLAVRRWSPKFVLVHRPDALFQEVDSLPRLAALLAAQPVPSGLLRGRSRLAIGASQTVLSDFYGRFHLDDHVVFGLAADVAAYWSVDNPHYCNACSHSTELPAAVAKQRTRCFIPGPESELGEAWLRWEHNRSATPLPESTEALIAARLVIVDVASFGHASVMHPAHHALAKRVTLRDFPLLPSARFQHKSPSPSLRSREPFGAMSVCARSAGRYDCTGATRKANHAIRTIDWPCRDADGPLDSASTVRHGGCLQ